MGIRRIIGIYKSIGTVLCDGHLQGKKVARLQKRREAQEGYAAAACDHKAKRCSPACGMIDSVGQSLLECLDCSFLFLPADVVRKGLHTTWTWHASEISKCSISKILMLNDGLSAPDFFLRSSSLVEKRTIESAMQESPNSPERSRRSNQSASCLVC